MKPTRRFYTRLLILFSLYPMFVGFTTREPVDHGFLDLVFGTGLYWAGCSPHQFYDAGATLKLREGPLVLLVRSGYFTVDGDGVGVFDVQNRVAPSSAAAFAGIGIGLDGEYGAIEGGVLYFSRTVRILSSPTQLLPFGSIRLGSDTGFHFTASFLNESTLASSGGMFKLGVGFPAWKHTSAWIGFGAGPYSSVQYILQVAIATGPRYAILMSVNAGNIFAQMEGAGSLGLRWRF